MDAGGWQEADRVEAWLFTPVVHPRREDPPVPRPQMPRFDPVAVVAAGVGAALVALALLGG